MDPSTFLGSVWGMMTRGLAVPSQTVFGSIGRSTLFMAHVFTHYPCNISHSQAEQPEPATWVSQMVTERGIWTFEPWEIGSLTNKHGIQTRNIVIMIMVIPTTKIGIWPAKMVIFNQQNRVVLYGIKWDLPSGNAKHGLIENPPLSSTMLLFSPGRLTADFPLPCLPEGTNGWCSGFPTTQIQGWEYDWLVVYLPLWKIWLRQLGWWPSQLNGKS